MTILLNDELIKGPKNSEKLEKYTKCPSDQKSDEGKKEKMKVKKKKDQKITSNKSASPCEADKHQCGYENKST